MQSLWEKVVDLSKTRLGRGITHLYFFQIPAQIIGGYTCQTIAFAESRGDLWQLPQPILGAIGLYLIFCMIPPHRPLPERLPNLKDVIWLALAFLWADFAYYTLHRIEHEVDFLYENVHYKHHEHDDEQEQWVCQWAANGSPYELFTVAIWVDLGYALLVHPLLNWLFGPIVTILGYFDHNSVIRNDHDFFRILITSEDHLKHHDFHYDGELGNYGARTRIFDYLMGTYV